MNEQAVDVENPIKLPIRRPIWLCLVALVIAIAFDQLAWGNTPGLIFLLTVLMILVGGFTLALVEKKRVPWQSWLLLLPILAAAVMTVFRLEVFTNFTNVIVAIYGLLLLAVTFLNGAGSTFRIWDVLENGFKLMLSMLIAPISLIIAAVKKNAQKSQEERKVASRRVSPVLRGLLIALPLVLVLGALLASADLIFSQNISRLFKWISLENVGEVIFRTFYVIVLAYALSGAYIYVLSETMRNKDAEVSKPPLVKPFLGHVEAMIVLGSINLLFATFLVVQFRYFFGGDANISLEGFTFAEYARKGFFELIVVALISMGIFFAFSHITKRESSKTRRVFSLLGLLLMAQVGVMLLSAFQRLSLYEEAYGFTQARLVTHVFIIWLAVLLAIMVVLEITRKLPRLAGVLLVIAIGFMATLNLLNVDAFIARQNIAHAEQGHPLDADYLVWSLSEDATPSLYEAYKTEPLDPDTRELLGAALACRSADSGTQERSNSWVSWHGSWQKANQIYQDNAGLLDSYILKNDSENPDYFNWSVMVNGIRVHCYDLNQDNEIDPGWD